MADRFIIIEGGVVTNDPGLPIIDLDVLEEGDLKELQDTRALAISVGAVEAAELLDDAILAEGAVPGVTDA